MSTVWTPIGELDIATAPLLETALEAALTAAETIMTVVDLTVLAFIDSSGLAVLIRATQRCAGVDRLRIVNHPAVERVLDLTALRDRLPIISPNDDIRQRRCSAR